MLSPYHRIAGASGSSFDAPLGPGRFPERGECGIGPLGIHLAVRKPDNALGHHLAHILSGDAALAGVFCLTDEHSTLVFLWSGRSQIIISSRNRYSDRQDIATLPKKLFLPYVRQCRILCGGAITHRQGP